MNYETLARRAEGQSDHYRELAKKAGVARNILRLSRDGKSSYCPACHEQFSQADFRRDWTPTKRAQRRGLRGTTWTHWHVCGQAGEERGD